MKFIARAPLVLLALLATQSVLMALSASSPEPSVHQDDRAHTRYPIVLAHGMMGFDHLGPVQYWRGIPQRLQAHGATVYVTQVSAFNASEVRGKQLLVQVEAIVSRTGASKVNLIGHSHGNQSIRYVAAMRPDLVASVTSVAGATGGSEVADWLLEVDKSQPWFVSILEALARGAGHLINGVSGTDLPQDVRAGLWAVSSKGAGAFTKQHPAGVPTQPCGEGAHEVNGVRFYSWSGVGTFIRAVNPADSVMALTGRAFKHEVSDGLVGRCASHLGQVIRDDYPMNHLHAVNLLWGIVGPDVDPVELFVAHAERLKAAGL
jgi:triacylglycerol lipase